MQFHDLARYFETLETTTARLKMYRDLGQLFQKASRADIAKIAYLCDARLLPPFTGVELGMGEKTVAYALALASGATHQKVARLYRRTGDLGLVAEMLSTRVGQGALSVSAVYASLLKISRMSGAGSVEKKTKMLATLTTRASPLSARYIVRFAVGRLRLGVGSLTMIEAAARLYPNRVAARQAVERAYNLGSDLGLVLQTLRTGGLKAIKQFKVRVGSPVRMMMAERLPSAERIISRLGRCSVESKLDGIRLQVHVTGRKVEIFSRNLESNTDMFPDIVKSVRSQVRARTAILEGEAVAVNDTTGEFYPFQITVQRKRKHRVEEMAHDYPLALVVTILADEITRSPIHTAGRDSSGEGMALRFPRMVGFIREDKSPEDATTVDEIKKMFRMRRKGDRPRRRRKADR